MKKLSFKILKYLGILLGTVFLFILFLLGYPTADPLSQKANDTSYIISNVNIVDIELDSIIERQSVYIEKDRILKISPADSMSVDGEIEIIDGSGKYLMSSLWDMHSHLGFQVAPQLLMPLHIANGVTNIRDMHSIVRLNKERAQWRKEIEDGVLLGPRILTFADEIVGANYDDQNVMDVVDRSQKDDRTYIKIYSGILEDRYFKLAEYAKSKGVDFAGHYPDAINPIDASRAGQKSFEHALIFIRHANPMGDSLRAYYNTYYGDGEYDRDSKPSGKEMLAQFDSDLFYELLDVMVEEETYFCPTHVTRNYEALATNEAFISDPNLKYIPLGIKFIWDGDASGMKEYAAKEGNQQYLEDLHKKGLELTGLAHKRGVKILAGTDNNDPYSFAGFTLHTELDQLVQAGLSPAEALETATIIPAEYFDLREEYGSVDVNKKADLLLLSANPLQEIKNAKSIERLFFNGSMYTDEDLEEMKDYVEDNANGIAGLSVSMKMFIRMAKDNRPEARHQH